MGGLTINLHLLLNTFYRPVVGGRYKILYEGNAFPSDRVSSRCFSPIRQCVSSLTDLSQFAFYSQTQLAGLDPSTALLPILPRKGEHTLRTSDILDTIRDHGSEIALILFGAVHWGTGQLLDMETITKAGKEAGCLVGWDCAHAAGNVPMRLHDWGADFAVWCTYKVSIVSPSDLSKLSSSIFAPDRVPRQVFLFTRNTSIKPGGFG